MDDLTHLQREQMYSLLEAYFANVTRAGFEEDLAEKSWVCTVVDPGSDRIHGFSTLMRFEVRMDGEPVTVLFSGDTIVDRSYWGQQVMHRVMGRHMLTLAEETPEARTFWLLLSSGYKTYRFLPAFFVEFFPRYDAPTPFDMRRLTDTFADTKFGSQYHKEAGVVRFERPAPLRPGVAEIDNRRMRNPHIAFFLRANPRHAAGDELVCIAELTRPNLTRAAHRMIGISGPPRHLRT
ncbi:MAG: hypothetical protein OXI26_11765 [bacterium]|nr:hypothetical protein [bacterium]